MRRGRPKGRSAARGLSGRESESQPGGPTEAVGRGLRPPERGASPAASVRRCPRRACRYSTEGPRLSNEPAYRRVRYHVVDSGADRTSTEPLLVELLQLGVGGSEVAACRRDVLMASELLREWYVHVLRPRGDRGMP